VSDVAETTGALVGRFAVSAVDAARLAHSCHTINDDAVMGKAVIPR